MKPATVTADGWRGVDVPRRVEAEVATSLRVDDMRVVRILLLTCEYEDGDERVWALPWTAALGVAELVGVRR